MTPEWKARVFAAIEQRKGGEQWLADQLTAHLRLRKPLKRWTIDKMLREQQTSTLVDAVCAVLKIDPPMVATPEHTDELAKELFTVIQEMTPDEQRAWISLVKRRDR